MDITTHLRMSIHYIASQMLRLNAEKIAPRLTPCTPAGDHFKPSDINCRDSEDILEYDASVDVITRLRINL
jgi:hypothetical protein